MPRRREVPKRSIPPDTVFGSELVTRFINQLMRDGKKAISERAFYSAMDLVRERTDDDPVKIFRRALDNVKPMVETKARRVGGSTYQIPIEVSTRRRSSLGIRWLIVMPGVGKNVLWHNVWQTKSWMPLMAEVER